MHYIIHARDDNRRLPTAICIKRLPPRFWVAKNTFITAYAIMIMQTSTISELRFPERGMKKQSRFFSGNGPAVILFVC